MTFCDDPMLSEVEPADLVTICYVLPASIAAAFQRETTPLLDRLHRARLTGDFDLAAWDSSAFVPPFNSNHRGDESAWDLPLITADDLKGVAWAVDHWTDTGRALVAGLLAAPAGGIHTFDLADQVGFTGGLPSAFRAIAGRLRAIERAPFWVGDPETVRHERGQLLSLGRGADVVRQVFEARHAALLDAQRGSR
jgi:hypothetical protein